MTSPTDALVEALRHAIDDILWMSGSDDFAPDGRAWYGWKKVRARVSEYEAALAAYAAAQKGMAEEDQKLITDLRTFVQSSLPSHLQKHSIARLAADRLEQLLASAPPDDGWVKVTEEIAAERKRQVEQEGWTAEHDDSHIRGELALAAACYAIASFPSETAEECRERLWPSEYWKPKDLRRDCIRAAALLVAEIERHDRIAYRRSQKKE